jgi:hypothetical protein
MLNLKRWPKSNAEFKVLKRKHIEQCCVRNESKWSEGDRSMTDIGFGFIQLGPNRLCPLLVLVFQAYFGPLQFDRFRVDYRLLQQIFEPVGSAPSVEARHRTDIAIVRNVLQKSLLSAARDA